ncbi:MAG: deoxyribose-phosphate aldolase [Patescibacteria group bacterium]
MDIAKYIDHTNVKPTATAGDIKKLCQEAKKFGFHSVCVTPTYVKLAKRLLIGSKVKTIVVIGFPHGSETTVTKAVATKEAIKNGAEEIDFVMNIGLMKDKKYQLVKKEMQAVKKAAGLRNVKVILETGYLTKSEIKKACQLAKQAGLDFVKTCTGFGPGQAKVEDIKLMRRAVGPKIGVKASGGIRDYQTAIKMIKAGANRIGTSAGVEIVVGGKSKNAY